MNERKLARFLGWFSIGLGLTEVLTPGVLTRFLGTRNRYGLVRTAYGLREIGAGVGILTQPKPAPWVWARVGGDALDLATLGVALKGENTRHRNVAIALGSVVAVTLLDIVCAGLLSKK